MIFISFQVQKSLIFMELYSFLRFLLFRRVMSILYCFYVILRLKNVQNGTENGPKMVSKIDEFFNLNLKQF